jgi:IPT/TIG domain
MTDAYHVSVTVTNPDGQTHTTEEAFTFDAAPAIASVTPASGPAAGGTPVDILGEHFAPGAVVLFGETPATQVEVSADGTRITCLSPAAS